MYFHSTTFPRVLQQKLPLINPNKTATHVDKTETNRAFCYLHRTFLYLSALVWWESVFVCQRRAAILRKMKEADFQKIPARPYAGRPLTDFALLSLFSGAPKGTETPKVYCFCCGFVSVPFGNCRETVRLPCLLFPAVKVYNGSKNFRRKTTSENSSNLRPLLLRCADGAIH